LCPRLRAGTIDNALVTRQLHMTWVTWVWRWDNGREAWTVDLVSTFDQRC